MPFFKDPYNDPNRIARQVAQQAADRAQALARQHQQEAMAAATAASRTAAEQQRRFAEDTRRRRDFQTQMRNADTRTAAGETSQIDVDIAPAQPRRGARLFGLILVAIIAFAAAKALGWI